ncbi:hypothetical protein [Methylocapsa aurea]|uniref:hypothetical protein n=1 Tax=Methylocapsa aurea TaxID=663610 RepID=UPI00068CC295|nr:hypothetical protein [Methylocapsa aurea]
MASLSLREAARATGASKSTILRAIQSGRLLAPKNDDGGYAIDPAELFRVYQPKAEAGAAEPELAPALAPTMTQEAPEEAQASELAARMAALESELLGLKDLLAKASRPRESWWKRLVG